VYSTESIFKILQLKYFKRGRTQELIEAYCTARKLLLKFSQFAANFANFAKK